MAHRVRRHILDLLRERGPLTTGDLAAHFRRSLTRFAVMQHLTVLVRADLVTIERRGRERLNHLNASPLQHALDRWIEPRDAPFTRMLSSLKHDAERRDSLGGLAP